MFNTLTGGMYTSAPEASFLEDLSITQLQDAASTLCPRSELLPCQSTCYSKKIQSSKESANVATEVCNSYFAGPQEVTVVCCRTSFCTQLALVSVQEE